MARVRRSRLIAAPPAELWKVAADPHHLPRWWPKTERVERVGPDGWTSVLLTAKGRPVRADYRVEASEAPARRAWSQELEGSPFERLLSSARTELRLRGQGEGTQVELELDQGLRGWARLGAPLVRRAARAQLDEALAGLDGLVAR